MLVESQYATFY